MRGEKLQTQTNKKNQEKVHPPLTCMHETYHYVAKLALGIMRPGVVQKNEAFYLKKKKIEKLLYIRFLLQNY